MDGAEDASGGEGGGRFCFGERVKWRGLMPVVVGRF